MTDRRPERPREAPSPVDVGDAGSDTRGVLGWTTGTIATASLFLLLLNAQALNGWAAEQVPSETMVRVTGATEGWLAATARMGIDTPRTWLHAQWKRAQAARFAGQPPAQE